MHNFSVQFSMSLKCPWSADSVTARKGLTWYVIEKSDPAKLVIWKLDCNEGVFLQIGTASLKESQVPSMLSLEDINSSIKINCSLTGSYNFGTSKNVVVFSDETLSLFSLEESKSSRNLIKETSIIRREYRCMDYQHILLSHFFVYIKTDIVDDESDSLFLSVEIHKFGLYPKAETEHKVKIAPKVIKGLFRAKLERIHENHTLNNRYVLVTIIFTEKNFIASRRKMNEIVWLVFDSLEGKILGHDHFTLQILDKDRCQLRLFVSHSM